MTALSTAETAMRRAPDDPGVPVTVSGAEAAALVAELDRLRGTGAHVEDRWRVGRKVGRTIYRQLGDEPSDDDPLIGVMDHAALATRACAANGTVHAIRDEIERLHDQRVRDLQAEMGRHERVFERRGVALREMGLAGDELASAAVDLTSESDTEDQLLRRQRRVVRAANAWRAAR